VAAQQSPRREVVTGVPRGTRHGSARTARQTAGVARPSASAEDRLRRLIRAQWRAALIAAGALVLSLGALPLLFAFVPAVAAARIGGVGIAWPVLGVFGYPVLYAIGRWYVARAEANEARFTGSSDDGGPPGARRGDGAERE
jgi:hypothetical protein